MVTNKNTQQSSLGPVARQLVKIQTNGNQTASNGHHLSVGQLQKRKGINWGLADKTFWNWLELLLVPLLIAGGGIWFQVQQHNTDTQIATDQQRETTLKSYIDRHN